ncbi:phage portal protein [Spectribacter hydrogenoxidans]|uniref:Phage portal protein n=1 Tax=Spectribacter hydrogenoxidans TaxID=3075608 RepID=A0ABU3C0L9_9GAMM|nr:phage portal protein [Salinisphaera sp. W335]MDT0635094.1 phage portal protein [Salinisphaera sp. W335]
MNWLDRAIASVAPVYGKRRMEARAALGRYEAARPSRNRKLIRDHASGDVHVQRDAAQLRSSARDLERNHDLARGVLSVMTRNIVGAQGIGIEPAPRMRDGSINTDLARDLRGLHHEWCKRPEVTWCHGFASMQRLACRAWLRDGEMFGQLLSGGVPGLDHGTAVPFSVEMLEADLVPLDYEYPSERIRQGVELNAWGRKVAYHVYKGHPGDGGLVFGSLFPALKRVGADRIVHPYMADRISQVRGVSIFASIITRLMDVKDYEESERVAAKVAASMAGYICKGTPDLYEGPATDAEKNRPQMKFSPGMIFDDLLPGEEIGTIDTKRPSDQVSDFRNAMLRAAASGADVGYSSVSRNYDGTYSAQRQELVEQWAAYAVLADQFVAQFVRPIWERFVFAAAAAGQIRVTRDIDVQHLADADFRVPPMPWIDPVKEAKALKILVDNKFKSRQQVIRERGGSWDDVISQWGEENRDAGSEGLSLEPDAAADDPTTEQDDDEESNNRRQRA